MEADHGAIATNGHLAHHALGVGCPFCGAVVPREMFHSGGQREPLKILGWHTNLKAITEFQEFYYAVVV